MIFLFLALGRVLPFADFMTKQMCNRKLEMGQFIMGYKVQFSEERVVLVTRAGEPLKSGDSYIPGETLEVDLSASKTKGDHLFQSSSTDAKFETGGCNGVRLAKNSFARKPKGNLTISVEASSIITIIAGMFTFIVYSTILDVDNCFSYYQLFNSTFFFNYSSFIIVTVSCAVGWSGGVDAVKLTPQFVLSPPGDAASRTGSQTDATVDL